MSGIRVDVDTVNLHQTQKIKLPDAIVAATAMYLEMPLITADKYFKKIKELHSVIIEI